MDQLPNEILLKILSHVSQRQLIRLELVSRRWSELVRFPTFWKKIDVLAMFADVTADTVVDRLARFLDGSVVECLEVARSPLSLRGVNQIMTNFYHVKTLSLTSYHRVLPKDKARSMWTVTCLTSLRLESCFCLNDRDAHVIATCCKRLKRLEIVACCNSLTDRGIAQFAHNCRNLEAIRIDSCAMVTSKGVAYLAQFCTKLKIIELSPVTDLDDPTLIDVAHANSDLEQLVLGSSLQVTDTSIATLARFCGKLKYIKLVNCPKVRLTGEIEQAFHVTVTNDVPADSVFWTRTVTQRAMLLLPSRATIAPKV